MQRARGQVAARQAHLAAVTDVLGEPKPLVEPSDCRAVVVTRDGQIAQVVDREHQQPGIAGTASELGALLVAARGQLELTGSIIYDHPKDFGESIADIANGTVKGLGRTVRAEFPLEQAAQAFAAVREVPGKTWIRVGS